MGTMSQMNGQGLVTCLRGSTLMMWGQPDLISLSSFNCLSVHSQPLLSGPTYSLITVVVELVVTSKSQENPKARAKREEDLSCSIYPHLEHSRGGHGVRMGPGCGKHSSGGIQWLQDAVFFTLFISDMKDHYALAH